MNSFVLYEFYRKRAALGLSWGVSHITVSWEESGLSHPLPAGSRNGEATVKDTDMEVQLSWSSLLRCSPLSPALIFSQKANEGDGWGNRCKGESD